jgi:hypothetical protein
MLSLAFRPLYSRIKNPSVPIVEEAEWTPEHVWTVCCLRRESNPKFIGHSARSLVAIPTEIFGLPNTTLKETLKYQNLIGFEKRVQREGRKKQEVFGGIAGMPT